MKLWNQIRLSAASPWMIGGAFTAGALALLFGISALTAGAFVWAALDIAGGLWLTRDGVVMLRAYRKNRTLLDAVETFRTTVRGLSEPPTFYVNDDLGLVFIRQSGRTPLYRWDALVRATTDEIGTTLRLLEDGERVPFIAEQFEIRSGVSMVFRSVEGTQVKLDENGEAHADEGPDAGLLHGMLNRAQALAAGLLQANELELVEVCAQLAAARPINPAAEESDHA